MGGSSGGRILATALPSRGARESRPLGEESPGHSAAASLRWTFLASVAGPRRIRASSPRTSPRWERRKRIRCPSMACGTPSECSELVLAVQSLRVCSLDADQILDQCFGAYTAKKRAAPRRANLFDSSLSLTAVVTSRIMMGSYCMYISMYKHIGLRSDEFLELTDCCEEMILLNVTDKTPPPPPPPSLPSSIPLFLAASPSPRSSHVSCWVAAEEVSSTGCRAQSPFYISQPAFFLFWADAVVRQGNQLEQSPFSFLFFFLFFSF